ncbi:MAG: ATP-binding cassette domain-containing protein [Bacilli bacterium]
MIALKNITKIYETKYDSIKAVDNLSLDFADVGFNFLVGPSGCGKTTLLNILGLLENNYRGDYYFGNVNISKLNESKLTSYRNNFIGYVFQDFQLIESLTVSENILISLELLNRHKDQTLVSEMLTKVGLSGFENKKISTLSGGEKQRVAIARALIKKPKLLLCDEPTGALDKETGLSVLKLIKEISKEILVICVTHDVDSAKQFADRLLTMKDGSIIDDLELNSIRKQNDQNKIKKDGKISFKRYFKMMGSYYFKKPLRGIFALFLSLVSVSILGTSIACSDINKYSLIMSGMDKTNLSTYGIRKEVLYDYNNSKSSAYVNFSDKEFSEFCHLIDGKAYPIYEFKKELSIDNLANVVNHDLYVKSFYGYTEVNESMLLENDLTYVGNLPSLYNEVMITDYQFEYIKEANILDTSDRTIVYEINSKEDILGTTLSMNNMNYIVTGVVDTDFNFNRYNPLKSKSTYTNSLRNELENQLEGSFSNVLYVSETFRINQLYGRSDTQNYDEITLNVSAYFDGSYFHAYDSFISTDLSSNKIIWLNDSSTCNDNEVVLPMNRFIKENNNTILNEGASLYADLYFEEIKENFIADYPTKDNKEDYVNYLINHGYRDKKYKPIDYEGIFEYGVYKIFNEKYLDVKDKVLTFTTVIDSNIVTYNAKIGGVIYDYDYYSVYNVFCSNDLLSEIRLNTLGYFNDIKSIIISAIGDEETIINNIRSIESYSTDNDAVTIKQDYIVVVDEYEASYLLKNASFYCYENTQSTFGVVMNVFSIVSIISLIIVVAFVLYLNISIFGEHNNELMILRALGEKKKNICFNICFIFFLASIIVSVLSILLGVTIVSMINNWQLKTLNSIFSIYTYSATSGLLVFSINTVISLICCFIPLFAIISRPISNSLKSKE